MRAGAAQAHVWASQALAPHARSRHSGCRDCRAPVAWLVGSGL